jgi:hypothetical protein
MARTLAERMIGAAMLDVSVYEEVEADEGATGQAALVVGIVAIAGAIGASGDGGSGMTGAVFSAFMGWLIWSGLTWFIGTRFFGGTATYGELLRTLGFAMAPGVLNILGFIPFLGGLVGFAVAIWSLIAGIIAIRQALDFDTGKAVATAVIGWLIMMAVVMTFAAMVFGAVMFGAALGGLAG